MMKVFISYSHEDEEMRERLQRHLQPLSHLDLIQTWYDHKIIAGQEIDAIIKEEMAKANLFILCISADSLSSRYIWEVEVKEACKRHKDGTAIVVPVIFRDCLWASIPNIAKIKALPKDGKAITEWKPHDKGYYNVAEGIKLLISEFNKKAKP